MLSYKEDNISINNLQFKSSQYINPTSIRRGLASSSLNSLVQAKRLKTEAKQKLYLSWYFRFGQSLFYSPFSLHTFAHLQYEVDYVFSGIQSPRQYKTIYKPKSYRSSLRMTGQSIRIYLALCVGVGLEG